MSHVPLSATPSDAPPAKLCNFINGKFVEPILGEFIDNMCPATGRRLCLVANSSSEDVDAAVAAAEAAFPAWSRLPTERRSQLLLALAAEIEKNVDKFALAESYDQGKPFWLARMVDIPRAVENFRFFATRIVHHEDHATHFDRPGGESLNYTVRMPFGVAGLISPWNLPLYLLSWKIAPAIAVGNTCVAKPSELTPLTATLLGEACVAVGMPPGVVNIVHGRGDRSGKRLVEHPRVRLVSFTGGTVTGRSVAQACAPVFKKVSLELGGKNATVVFADCDFDQTVAGVLRASFTNQGEVCLCGSRVLLQREIYDRFVAALVKGANAMSAICVDPRSAKEQPQAPFGALISRQHRDKVHGYVELGKQEGGQVLCGGRQPTAQELPSGCGEGYFYLPTILQGLGPNARCNQEEIFGPVVTVMPFDTEQEAIAIANGVVFGLSSSVWTSNGMRAQRVALQLEAAYVWINCWLVRDLRMPFGGMKASGMGREGGTHSIDFYTDLKTICSKL